MLELKRTAVLKACSPDHHIVSGTLNQSARTSLLAGIHCTLRQPSRSMPEITTPARAVDFLTLAQSLKLFKRTGWIKKGVQLPESIADHMYRMSLMALIAGDANVDCNRCLQLAIAHDLAEAIVGDISPGDGISKAEKNRRETSAMKDLRETLGSHTGAGQIIEELWQEYEDSRTPEAKLVKDFDKIEMILQAHEYEQAQGIELQEFFDSTAGKFQTELGKSWAAEVVKRRQSSKNKSEP